MGFIIIEIIASIIFIFWFIYSISSIKAYQRMQVDLLRGIAEKSEVDEGYFPRLRGGSYYIAPLKTREMKR